MQLYRSWGRNGRVSGQPAEQNFKQDHDGMLDIKRNIRPQSLPERSVFGLPHNYFFSSQQPVFKVDIAPRRQNAAAALSPLFIHIHQFPDGKYALIQTLLAALFLPENEKVEFKPKPGSTFSIPFTQDQIQWEVLHHYLDRFTDRERVL
ncbi:MAG: hypothetical protein R3E89_07315 [Thiolinea sp.]